MDVRRISWQGASRARWLRERMEQRLTHWWRGWFSEGAELLELQLPATTLSPKQIAELEWHSLHHQDQHFMLGVPDGLSEALAARALHLREGDISTVMDGVALACRDDLIASLWGEGPHAPLVEDDPPVPWKLEPRHGGLLFQLELLSARVWVWVNRAWCDANGPDVPAAVPRVLTNRRTALASSPVRLLAQIDMGQITLADSLDWAVGEVLLTDMPRLARVELSTDRARVASGVLGQAGASRHITLT